MVGIARASLREKWHPAESDALLLSARICRIAADTSNDNLYVSASSSAAQQCWRGNFSKTSRVLSLFVLFEWLMRLPSEEQTLKLTFGHESGKPFEQLRYPRNEQRDSYRRDIERTEKKLSNSETALEATLKALFTGYDQAIDDMDILRFLARWAIFSKGSDASILPAEDDPGALVMTVYHPDVLLMRLRAFYLLSDEFERGSCAVSPVQDDSDRLGAWPFLDKYLRQPASQFYKDSEGKTYVLNPRSGTLAFFDYRPIYQTTSLYPAPITNIAEKLMLDIQECQDKKSIRIAIVGSIFKDDVYQLAASLTENLPEQINQRIDLSVLTPCETTQPNTSHRQLTMNIDHETELSSDKLEWLAKESDILFLIDLKAFYASNADADFSQPKEPAPYIVTEQTVKFDVLDRSRKICEQYMAYSGRLSLNRELLKACIGMTGSDTLSHLCLLTSYDELSELLSLSRSAREIRKELVYPHCYTTLFRFSSHVNKACGNDVPPYFLFRLHQWYKMFDPYMRVYHMNDMNMASVLRNVICQLRVASGAWSIRLYNDRSNGGSALSASQKELIAKQIASRIVYAVKGDELYGIARGYAKKSLINLLISRSISNRHLLIARSLLYNSSDMVSVEWTEDDLDLDKYCKRMRTYQTRYSDYLLLCAIDRDSQSPDTASQVFHLLSAFEREDGLSSVYRLGYESDQMISEGYGFMPDIREFYRRISHQARLIVK